LLVVILFGNLVVNILFFSMSAVMALEVATVWGVGAEALVGVAVLIGILVFGEMIPKALGMSFAEELVGLVAVPLRGWYHLLGPFRRVLESVSAWLTPTVKKVDLGPDELKMLIDSTAGDRGFGRQEKGIVEEIINLPETRVRSLMVPRVSQTFWNGAWSVERALEVAAEHPMDLLPIFMEHEEQVVGYVELSVLFAEKRGERRLIELSEPVVFVPETMRADRMLERFMDEPVRMAAVVDEYGGLAGTLRVGDLLEEVVGEFAVPEVPEVEVLGEHAYRLQGQLSIREWRELFVGFVPVEAMNELALDTVSGLVVSLLKRMPVVGDEAWLGNLCFTVERVRGNRVESVRLSLAAGGAR
jgi:CBS domain containing-hemolysin-like protein